jgi:hypothetical protein
MARRRASAKRVSYFACEWLAVGNRIMDSVKAGNLTLAETYLLLRQIEAMAACVIGQSIHRESAPVTTTPEDTLREAGITDARQAGYQRKMSTVLSGRLDGLGKDGA